LRFFGSEDVVALDKTGTVTEGCYKVQAGLESLNNASRRAVYSLVSLSLHPVASAIAQALKPSIHTLQVDAFEEIAGHGIKGEVQGTEWAVGSDIFMQKMGIDSACAHTSAPGKGVETVVYISAAGACVARVILGDTLRSDAPAAVAAMAPAEVMLISGDGESAVAEAARRCGITSWKSRATPLDKRELIENLKKQGKVVCMVGDGINDAPALTAADVGISVVSATDMSIQVSDIVLTTAGLDVLPKIRALASRGRMIVRQNLFWAFFFNVVGIALAAAGMLSPVFAAFAMSISSLVVLFNAKRL
jgi:P-type E1-E2 ATPase